MRGLHLVALVLTGCAGFTSVPLADWQTVPAAERAALDRAHDAKVAETEGELYAIILATAEDRRLLALPAVHRADIAPAAPGDSWAAAIAGQEQRKAEAIAQIDSATVAVHRADLAWRELRAELLTEQLDVLRSEREVERAKAIDHHLLGTDTYDGAEYRGQLAKAQARWFAIEPQVEAALAVRGRTSGELAGAKETYASLVRSGPLAPTSEDVALRLPDVNMHSIHREGERQRLGEPKTEEHYLTRPRVAIR